MDISKAKYPDGKYHYKFDLRKGNGDITLYIIGEDKAHGYDRFLEVKLTRAELQHVFNAIKEILNEAPFTKQASQPET